MPTSSITKFTSKGICEGMVPATATKPGYMVFALPGTAYKVHLAHDPAYMAKPGSRIKGVITADARRVDRVGAGGRYVEPVFGKPRRVQGTLVGVDAAANTITVECGGGTVPGFEHPMHVTAKLLDARQKATDFALGELLAFDCPGVAVWHSDGGA